MIVNPDGTPLASPASELSEEDASKDAYFEEIGDVVERMIARHGKDFAIGVLIIAARFVAEDKALIRPK